MGLVGRSGSHYWALCVMIHTTFWALAHCTLCKSTAGHPKQRQLTLPQGAAEGRVNWRDSRSVHGWHDEVNPCGDQQEFNTAASSLVTHHLTYRTLVHVDWSA